MKERKTMKEDDILDNGFMEEEPLAATGLMLDEVEEPLEFDEDEAEAEEDAD